MTIDEAIRRLTIATKVGLFEPDIRELQAIKLGIEALKRVKDCRDVDCDFAPQPLPGETKE